MRRVFGYLKDYVVRMIFGFMIKFFGTIMDLFLPWIMAYIIDNVVPTKNKSMVFVWGFLMIVCAIFAVLGNIIANRMASSVARDTTRRIRHDLFSKVMALSCNQVDKVSIPSLVSRMTTDTYNIHGVIGMIQRLGVRAPILFIGGIIVTLTLDPVLSMLLIALLPVLAIIIYIVSKKGIPLYSDVQKSVDSLVRKVRENITGVRVVKALSRSENERQAFARINKQVVDKETKAATVMAISNPTMNFILNIGWILIIIVGAKRVNAGLCKGGTIVAFLTYFTIILNSLMMITRLFMSISKAMASAMRIDEVMSLGDDITVLENKYPKDDSLLESDFHIEFNDVNFSYNGTKNNLSDFNVKIKRGESLGIIGATGSGKTTVIKLLMRLYDINDGEIKINGINIKDIDENLLHSMFGVVFQNDTIFEDTVFENINLGRGIELEDAIKAARIADIHTHIESMEKGYESDVAIRGANLSGGQKQRLLIARALSAKPQILILDDSSSALDYKTDAGIRASLKEEFGNTTKIVIAQRVSAVKDMTNILVLDEGRIIGYGTHNELLESCEVYKEISDSQMGGDMDA